MASEKQEEFYSTLSILIIEDNAQVLGIIRSLIHEMGFEKIQGVTDGAEALGLIDATSFDLIVCDWSLPQVSGLDILRHVRGKSRKTPFIMITGMALENAVRNAIESGVTAYITKPFQIDEVERKIATILKTNLR